MAYCNDGGQTDAFGGKTDPLVAMAGVGALCPLGTDCEDCGTRIFCLSCPLNCQVANSAVPKAIAFKSACLEGMYHNGVCDEACNTAKCDFDGGDCSMAQMGEHCLREQSQGGIDYRPPPIEPGLSSFPVAMRLKLSPMSFQSKSEVPASSHSHTREASPQWPAEKPL